MKIQKTNAMRILDSNRLPYEVFSYAHGTEPVAGLAVAKQLQEDPEQVFKTLVTVANTKEYIVFVIPVAYELHLKKCAKAAGVKSVEMIHVKAVSYTHLRGICSRSSTSIFVFITGINSQPRIAPRHHNDGPLPSASKKLSVPILISRAL